MQKNSIKNTVMLLLAAMIWGFAFVAQSTGMNYVGPYTFNAVRSFMGSLVLFPVAFLGKHKLHKTTKEEKRQYQKRKLGLEIRCSICYYKLKTYPKEGQV